MPDTEHTPGPWTFDGYDGDQGYEVGGPPDYCGILATAHHDTDEHDKGEAEANARLIASAPDLLSALELACDGIEGVSVGSWYADQLADIALPTIKAAIAKARGTDS